MTRADSRARPGDYRGPMTPSKAARIIAGMSPADVVLGITGACPLVRDHVITPTGPLPSSIVLDVLADRIRASRAERDRRRADEVEPME